ncbi:GGDEF domain-containing protein [Mycoplasmatota bacterium]|nr:GGDEF domain-containing protein [Mycoplasmatota bacterium]
MTLMTSLQRNILAFALIIIFSIMIYVLWLWIKKERKHAIETKFIVLDNIITYKKMKELIQYKIHQKGENTFFSLMMVTIDHFDQILDYTDSNATTEYIQRVGKLLEMVLPLGSKMAQTDERETFIIYMPEIYEHDDFLDIANQFKMMAERRIELDQGVHIEKSASLALIAFPEHDETLYGLIQGLQSTIYHVKKRGGGHIQFYSADMLEEKNNYEAYQKLKKAIKDQSIEMLFKPVFSKKTLHMSGVEIDLTWHKENEKEHYREFMPKLESSNDSYWFGLWMLEKALSSHISMIGLNQRQSYELIMPVGVRQFENEMISHDIIHVLDKYELETSQMVLKIVNPMQVNQEIQFIKTLIELQSYGIRLALDINRIDDHLYYLLNEYKIDMIFIDQELLTKKHDKSVEVEELLNYAIANQMDMIATEINNKDQVYKLDDHFNMIQGPFCSVPLNKDQLLDHLNMKLDIES